MKKLIPILIGSLLFICQTELRAQCPALDTAGTQGDHGSQACFIPEQSASGAGDPPVFTGNIPDCTLAGETEMIVYAIYPCGTYPGGDVDPADPNYLGYTFSFGIGSITADPVTGFDPYGYGESCLTYVPFLLCENLVIYGTCLPTDPASATDINFPGVEQITFIQDPANPGQCNPDGSFTINYIVSGGTGSYIATVDPPGSGSVTSNDGAGNIAITITDPDPNDTTVINSGTIVRFFDITGCGSPASMLADYDAFLNCNFVVCPTLLSATIDTSATCGGSDVAFSFTFDEETTEVVLDINGQLFVGQAGDSTIVGTIPVVNNGCEIDTFQISWITNCINGDTIQWNAGGDALNNLNILVYPPASAYTYNVIPADTCGLAATFEVTGCPITFFPGIQLPEPPSCPAGNDGNLSWFVSPNLDLTNAPTCAEWIDAGLETIAACDTCQVIVCPTFLGATFDTIPVCGGDSISYTFSFNPSAENAFVVINGVGQVGMPGDSTITVTIPTPNTRCGIMPFQVDWRANCITDAILQYDPSTGMVGEASGTFTLDAIPPASAYSLNVIPADSCGQSPVIEITGCPLQILDNITPPDTASCPAGNDGLYSFVATPTLDLSAYDSIPQCAVYSFSGAYPITACEDCPICSNTLISMAADSSDLCAGDVLTLSFTFRNSIDSVLIDIGGQTFADNPLDIGIGPDNIFNIDYIIPDLGCVPVNFDINWRAYCTDSSLIQYDTTSLMSGNAEGIINLTVFPAADSYGYQVLDSGLCDDVPTVLNTGNCNYLINQTDLDPGSSCPVQDGLVEYSVVDPYNDLSPCPIDTITLQLPFTRCNDCDECPLLTTDFSDVQVICEGEMVSLPADSTIFNALTNADNAVISWSPAGSTPVLDDPCMVQTIDYELTILCTLDPIFAINGGTVSVTVYPDEDRYDLLIDNGGCNMPPFVVNQGECALDIRVLELVFPIDGCPPQDGWSDWEIADPYPNSPCAFETDTMRLIKPACDLCVNCPTTVGDFSDTQIICEGTLPNLPSSTEILNSVDVSGDAVIQWSLNPGMAPLLPDPCTPFTFNYVLTIGCSSDSTVSLDGGTIEVTVYPNASNYNTSLTQGSCGSSASVANTGLCDLNIQILSNTAGTDGCPPQSGALTYVISDPHPASPCSMATMNGSLSNPGCEDCPVIPEIDLELDKTSNVSGVVQIGDQITYTLTIVNNGPDPASNVQVVDQLPAGLTFITASPASDYNSVTGIWMVGNLAVGASSTLEITAVITHSGSITNVAQVVDADEDDTDSTPDNNDESEDDQDDHVIIVSEEPPPVCDPPISCGTVNVCTEAITPITICPDVCNIDGGYTITDVYTTYHCSVVVSNGCIIYTPLPGMDYIGEDQITIHITDTYGNCYILLVDVQIGNCTPDNPPIAENDYETSDGSPVDIDVLDNDSHPDGDDIHVCDYTQPANGTVVLVGDTFVYIPNPGFSGTDVFTYTICDEDGDTDTAVVYIDVDPVIDCENEDLEYCLDLHEVVEICPEFCALEGTDYSITETHSLYYCSVYIIGDHCIRYTPLPGFTGQDQVTVTACNNNVCDEVIIHFTVAENGDCDPNNAPVAIDDSATTYEDTPVTINVLPNDYDPDGDAFYICSNTNPQNGTVQLVGNQFVYTPNPGFSGYDTFTYTICDGQGGTDTAVVTIYVIPDPNCEADFTVCTAPLTPIDLCVDFCDDNMSIASAHTTFDCGIQILSENCLRYIPLPGLDGSDLITVVGTNAYGQTETVYVTVIISDNCYPQPAVIANDDFYTTLDSEALYTFVLNNDEFPADCYPELTVLNQPQVGTVLTNDNQTFTYIPQFGYEGVVNFNYRLCCGDVCDDATVTINVVLHDDCDFNVVIGKMISPNGDGVNDVLNFNSSNSCNINNDYNAEIRIFNRMGELVFSEKDFSDEKSWNGTFENNGTTLPNGTYFYEAVISTGNDMIRQTGFIELRN